MRMNLKVPFAEKDQAKKLGARWDAARKVWYIGDNVDAAAFSKWSPTPHEVSSPPAVAETVHVGCHYVERPRVCDCAPWDDCDKCRLDATSK